MQAIVHPRERSGGSRSVQSCDQHRVVRILHGKTWQKAPSGRRMPRREGFVEAAQTRSVPILVRTRFRRPGAVEAVLQRLGDQLGQTPGFQGIARSPGQSGQIAVGAPNPQSASNWQGDVAIPNGFATSGPNPARLGMMISSPGVDVLVQGHQRKKACHRGKGHDSFCRGPQSGVLAWFWRPDGCEKRQPKSDHNSSSAKRSSTVWRRRISLVEPLSSNTSGAMPRVL